MIISIKDDFDLDKIANSGQAFRVGLLDNGCYRFIFRDKVLYIRKETGSKCDYQISCDQGDWNDIWTEYFDLKRSYSKIRESVDPEDLFLKEAATYGNGLRILKQDAFEMLITFIISQRKSIPAIKQSVELICEKYGELVKTEYEDIYLFPSPDALSKATADELKDCKLGYRVEYIQSAANMVSSGKLDLEAIYSMPYEELFEALKAVKGVGDKVSNCICLFAYAKVEAAPVDTWINKVIETKYSGVNPFPGYGDEAGIMQQYIFYYAQTHKDSFD